MTLRFGDFEIDLDRQELRDSTGPVDVEPQVFRLLGYLIEQRDRVVSKDELVEKVWSGRFVSDATVTSRINLLRKTVGDSGSAQSVIKTFSKRGYRFVADIVQTGAQNAEAPRDVPAITPVSPKVVVLPFVRLGGDDADFLAEGTTEEITVALSRCSDVAVIANRSARAVAEESTVVSEIGRELGAQYVVRGSVQRSAAQVRVTAQLVDTRIGKHLWAEVFTGAAAEIFEIQESVARSLAAVLPGRISASNARRDPPGGDAGLSEYGAFW